MRPLKIALLQIAPCGGLEENLEKGILCLSGKRRRWGGYRFVPRDVEQRIQYLRTAQRRSGRLRLFRPAAALSVPSSGLPGSWKWPSASRFWKNMREARAIRLFF